MHSHLRAQRAPVCGLRHQVQKIKKHSPNFQNVQWDKQGLLAKLKNWPPGETVNWSALGREFSIPDKNRGQVVKEFAAENGVNVFELDRRPANTRLRARKLRMPGGGISVPTHRTAEGVKEDWKQMIASGELTLAEPCHHQTITKYKVKNGELERSETTVYGRKIPLTEVREKLLRKHERVMHLHTDNEFEAVQKEQILEIYKQRNIELPNELSEEVLCNALRKYERTRTIAVWHDHATILGRGYILLTAKIMYDPAVFKSNQETTLSVKDIQAYVEEPEICMIAISSSSINDQVALIADRMNCIKEMNVELCTENGISIMDRLMFFYGDKPAVQFERGTQVGGYYPCGSCGAHHSRFDDFAHLTTCNWRSLQQLQTLVTKG